MLNFERGESASPRFPTRSTCPSEALHHRSDTACASSSSSLAPPLLYRTRNTHSMPAKSLFILGTGFIGGSVLAALLEKKDQYSIAALCRDPKKADQLKELGVRPVQGELASDELIAKEAAEADVSSYSSSPPLPTPRSCTAELPRSAATSHLHAAAQ